jgi:hypothetical protein
MTPPINRPQVIVVPHRQRRGPKGLALAIAVMLIATVGLVLRATVSDWRGLSQEAQHRVGSWFASAAKPPTLVAKATTSKPEVPNIVPPEKEKVEAPSPWDDIKKSAEKAKADREEVERIKAKAAEELDKNPPPPLNTPFRRGRAFDPAVIAELQRRHAEAVRQMQAEMGDHQRLFEDMIRRQAGAQQRFLDEFARNAPRGFGNLPPGFENFGRPLPGMDRMRLPQPPRPGINREDPAEPRIQEDSGEEVRDGVRMKWKTRVIILGR